MRTDSIVRVDAINVLLANLGEVDTERFISMIKRDTFDYTEWRRDLFKGKSIEEIHAMATDHEKNQRRA
ncbi:MAG: hypothetical protein FWH10_03350 [Oscillospiraceae bacterium]|nr:hypothetical protein [Oscillospiraceae bacterium]